MAVKESALGQEGRQPDSVGHESSFSRMLSTGGGWRGRSTPTDSLTASQECLESRNLLLQDSCSSSAMTFSDK